MGWPFPMNTFDTLLKQVRSRNRSGKPAEMPAMLLENPLRQLLIESARTMLPPDLASRLDRARSVEACTHWFGLAALYQQVHGRLHERQAFLEILGSEPDPARAVNAAIAARTLSQNGPTSRDAIWARLDRLGVVLQIAMMGVLFVVRGIVMHLVAVTWPQIGWCCLVPVAHLVGCGDMLPTLMPDGNWLGLLWLLVVSGWLAVEYLKGPWLMEYARQLPAKIGKRPLPTANRLEVLYDLWRFQSIGTLVYLIFYWLGR